MEGFRDLPRPSEAKELEFKPSAFGIPNLKTSLNVVLPATKNWAIQLFVLRDTSAVVWTAWAVYIHRLHLPFVKNIHWCQF